MAEEINYKPMEVFSWLIKQGLPFWPLSLAIVVLSSLIAFVNLGYAEVFRQLVNAGVSKDLALATEIIKLAIFLAIVGIVVRFFKSITTNYFSNVVTKQFEEETYSKGLNAKQFALDKYHSGELIEKISQSAPNALKGVTWKITEFFERVLTVVLQIGYMARIDLRLTWLALVFSILAPMISTFFSPKIRQANDRLHENSGKLQSLGQDTLQNIEIAKAYSAQSWLLGRIEPFYQKDIELNKKASAWGSLVGALHFVAIVGGYISIMALGGRLAILGEIDVGAILAMLIVYEQVGFPLTRLANLWPEFQNAISQGKRGRDIWVLDQEVLESSSEISIDTFGDLELKKVCFGYNDDKFVLNDLDFVAKAGEITAIVGPSGSGKSTLFKLLLRLYEPQGGDILWNNQPVADFSSDKWRSHIGYVSQTPLVFAATVRENIICGLTNISQEEVVRAAKAARIHHVIEKLPEGYNTLLGERGSGLSGGELQRIVLARFFLRESELAILLLDEATSAIDSENEKSIQETFAKLFPHRTTIVIAHRLSTIQYADRILYLEEGRVVEAGTYHELMALGGRFYELTQKDSLETGVESIG